MPFGGAVKLTGESEYRRALAQITQNLREVSSQMTLVSASYDKNDKSQAALAAQIDVLNKKQEQQIQKLNTLKMQYANAEAQMTKQANAHKNLVSEYESEKTKLDEIGRTLGTSSKEYQTQQKHVAELAKEVTRSTAAQDANEKSMSKMRSEINYAQADVQKTAKELDGLRKEEENAGDKADDLAKAEKKAGDEAKNASDGGFTVMKGVLANLATEAIDSAINGLKQLGGTLIDVGKQAIGSYASYEQLEGGVKKIFGADLAEEVKANADKAFKTAGMSANQYMDTVTSFSATLMAGLGDDTSKAASYADTAIRNMADNANTFGTDIASIQNAYQGFAKDNFTMLDNLKLGYGGTAGEMARLINESGVMGDAFEATAKNVKDIPFYKMIEAIDKTQERLGIMGTTAAEAAGTIEGSTGSMQAAWQNMLTGFADENADFEQLTTNFLNTIITPDGKGGAFGTVIPRISNVITGMSTALQTLLPQLISTVVPIIQENLPIIIEALSSAMTVIVGELKNIVPIVAGLVPEVINTVISLLPQLLLLGSTLLESVMNGITVALPELFAMIPQLIDDIVYLFSEQMPDIIESGIQLLQSLIQGIMDTLPALMEALPDIISTITDVLTEYLPVIIEMGTTLLLNLINGIVNMIPQLAAMLPQIINTIISVLSANLPQIITSGVTILVSLIHGITSAIPQLVAMLPTIIQNIVSTLLSNLPLIINAGIQLLVALVSDMPKIIAGVVTAIPQIISAITTAIAGAIPDIVQAGTDLISGLWEGIGNAKDWILGKIGGFCDDILGGIKSLFGIHSPSTVFRDEIGENLALGLGEGFTDEMRSVSDQMQDAIPTSFNVDSTLNTKGGSIGGTYADMLGAFKQALAEMKIELDDEVAGRFVDKTVTRLVYN